jgi:hypothetical protein
MTFGPLVVPTALFWSLSLTSQERYERYAKGERNDLPRDKTLGLWVLMLMLAVVPGSELLQHGQMQIFC